MKITTEILSLATTHPFTIARGGSSSWRTVWVRLTDHDGIEGWGEAAPSRFYGETAETVLAAIEMLRPILENADPSIPQTVEDEMARTLRNNGSARAAISAAMHDLMGKRLGVPLHQMWGLDASRMPRTSFTIGLGSESELRQKVREAASYPVLKVKLGTDRDESIIRTIRDAAPDAVLRVDANAAWTPKSALAFMDVLVECGVEFVEQPLPPEDLEGLRFVRERASLPIIADESCISNSDIPRLAGAVDGINIKLAKCGGLREAARMAATARAHGMLVMMGCMVESSLGISAAAQLAPLLDYADLDGAALLSNDPFVGTTIDGGIIRLGDGPGLGVARA